MVSISQKLASFTRIFSVCLTPLFILICTYISRLRMFGYFLKKNDSDIIIRETEKEDSGRADKSELHMKFKFPSFEEFSRRGNSEVLSSANCNKYQLASVENSAAAFFEVLTTFSVKEFNCDGIEETGVENGTIEAIDFQESKAFAGDHDFLDFTSEENYDSFLSDGDFGEETGLESNEVGECFGDEINEIKNVEQNDLGLKSEFLSDNDFHDAGFVSKDDKSVQLNSADSNKLESLWEHQELIEQLQMELRKAKATGLPTIFEESESPKMMEELKPWKIDDEFEHENFMGELHTSYKSYIEMMRKFDILNYQKMYAMGFVQLKDSFHSASPQKASSPTLKSLVSQNLWLFRHKSHGTDPMRKFVNELQGDLEVVYVGQMCLSWEFLHWQYQKALDLWNSDPHGVHRYNEVAGEFQQFQVLIQRFTENEPFEGPRVQNYVKSRCVLRNLLQVPLVREDCLEENTKGSRMSTGEYVITSENLVEMVEESIRIFWQFVRADKDCAVSMTSRKKMPELQSPQDTKLLVDVRKTLQKKEKKLKDILKSEKCILRKFRGGKEDDLDEALHFFAQVDVKLVSRVANMSNISRDQLIWCRNKLSSISIVNRKISMEHAFLLFPC